jgi:hypothetical protein
MPRALVAASLLFDCQHCLRLCLNHRVMVSRMRSYPSLIVEVILAVFGCRGNRFSMLIEATLGSKLEIPTRKQMRCRLD